MLAEMRARIRIEKTCNTSRAVGYTGNIPIGITYDVAITYECNRTYKYIKQREINNLHDERDHRNCTVVTRNNSKLGR